MPPDILHLHRFNGTESYPVIEARYRAYRDEDDDTTRLLLRLTTGGAVATLEDTASIGAEPSWEIEWNGSDPVGDVVRVGAKLRIPASLDERLGQHVTNFYYCEHEGTDDNEIEILEVGENTIRVKLGGSSVDANFYDGSKPPMRLELVATFRLDSSLRRSFE